MIALKIRKTWFHVGDTPLAWSLIVDGAAYYIVFVLAFGLEGLATSNSEVGSLRLCNAQQTLTRGI